MNSSMHELAVIGAVTIYFVYCHEYCYYNSKQKHIVPFLALDNSRRTCGKECIVMRRLRRQNIWYQHKSLAIVEGKI